MITAHIANEDLKKALNDVKKYNVKTMQRIRAQIETTSWNIDRKAKTNCPVKSGILRGSIRPQFGGRMSISEISARVGTNVHYAPYVEFGTGANVSVPTGVEDYAIQFKGKGIRQVNRYAHPFLFPAAESERRTFEKNMLKILNDTRPIG